MQVILMSCESEKYPLAKICELESSMSPNIWKVFAGGITSLLVEKILLAKLCKWTEKLTVSPDFHNTHLTDMYRLLPYGIPGSLSVLAKQTSEKVTCKL